MLETKNLKIFHIIMIVIIGILLVLIFTTLNSNSIVETSVINLKNEVASVNNNIESADNQVAVITEDINSLQIKLDENLSEIDLLRNGARYESHDPTYSELIDFLAEDLTNKNKYIEDVYVCRHFATEVNNNAEKIGLRCAYVGVNFTGLEPHALVGFNTTDRGMIYYDAQIFSVNNGGTETQTGSNWRVDLEIGKDYFADCVKVPYNRYYPHNPDCIIVDFTIYW